MKAVIAYSHSGDDTKAYDNGMMTKELHIKRLSIPEGVDVDDDVIEGVS